MSENVENDDNVEAEDDDNVHAENFDLLNSENVENEEDAAFRRKGERIEKNQMRKNSSHADKVCGIENVDSEKAERQTM